MWLRAEIHGTRITMMTQALNAILEHSTGGRGGVLPPRFHREYALGILGYAVAISNDDACIGTLFRPRLAQREEAYK